MKKQFKLYHDDCLRRMDKLIKKGVVVDSIICDIPYGTTNCKWDTIIPFDDMWERLHKLIKSDGAIVLFGSEPFSSALRMSNIKEFKYDWIWEKQKASNFMGAKYSPLKYHEIISVFSKSKHIYNPQKYNVLEFSDILNMTDKELLNVFETKSYDRFGVVDRRKTITNPKTNKEHVGSTITRTRKKDDGFRYPKSVLKINKGVNTNLHPTQKPIALMEYLVKTYTNENEIVLDFTMGSGTTGVACKNLNRKFIGIELDEKYFDIAKERITS
jgi:site-specific DNA-methyltransferase (adenine-specific)